MLFLPTLSFAQPAHVSLVELEVIKNQTLVWEFNNCYQYATITGQAEYGNAYLEYPNSGYVGDYQVVYTPDADFVGVDEVVIRYYKALPVYPGKQLTEAHLRINVIPAFIKAVDDFARTTASEPIVIDVLANDDWLGTGEPHVEGVTLANSGVGTCTPGTNCGSVTFTPNADFTGIAHFNYTICDDDGNCDDAIVNISVSPENEPQHDTLKIITSRDVSKVVLFDLTGYDLVSDDWNHGTIGFDEEQEIPTYVPNGTTYGYDYITYEKYENGLDYTRTVEVHVLDTPLQNGYLFADNAYTSAGSSVIVDVAANDKLVPQTYVVNQLPSYGSITPVNVNGSIQYRYTPNNSSFIGVDQFAYGGYVGGSFESAVVTVYVNNQIPSRPLFRLNTTKNVPLVLEYGVPINSYSFELVGTGAEHGTAEVFPGYSEQTWNGQTATGNNLISYTPNPGFTGTDEFEVQYSVDGSDVLATVKLVVEVLDVTPPAEQLCIGNNCVYPGDTNKDGVVNMKDLLPIGLCMGEEGTERYAEAVTEDWYGQYSQDWNDPFERPGYDLKHIDTDGDSIISHLDTAAIRTHYGKINNILPVAQEPASLPIYLKLNSTTTPQPGDLVSFDIYLGDSGENTEYALDIHGITSTLNYDPAFVEPGSMHMTFPTDTWMSYDAPTMGMYYDFHDSGHLDFGFTRTNGVAIDGYGLIAKADFIVVEDLLDSRPGEEGYITLPFSLSGSGVMNGAGTSYNLADAETMIEIHIPATDEKREVNNSDLKVFPNPTNNVVNLYLNGLGSEVESFEIYNVAGQLMTSKAVNAKSATINVSAWNSGLYIVKAITKSGDVLNSKFEVAK